MSEVVGPGVRSLWQGLNHLLWPAACELCREPVDEQAGGLCRQCWATLLEATAGDYCRSCGRDASPYGTIEGRCGHCMDLDPPWDGIARAGAYAGAMRDLILALKFRDRTEFAARLAAMADAALQAGGFADRIELLVPVPLHWRRRFWRGFNQSLLIARGLSSCPAPICTDLVRVRYTQRQWSLTPAGRRRNVRGAFAVRRGHPFAGRAVCLVDDITTSGATLDECAGVLREAGATQVYALVAAVAMQDTG